MSDMMWWWQSGRLRRMHAVVVFYSPSLVQIQSATQVKKWFCRKIMIELYRKMRGFTKFVEEMEELTREQRNECYKKAHRVIKEGSEDAICLALGFALMGKGFDLIEIDFVRHIPDLFPEFWQKRPSPSTGLTDVWFLFDAEGREKRLKILAECIEETETVK